MHYRQKVVWTPTVTWRCFICSAISKSTPNHLKLGLLEPCAVKAARTVLRGGGGGDVTFLPDIRTAIPVLVA